MMKKIGGLIAILLTINLLAIVSCSNNSIKDSNAKGNKTLVQNLAKEGVISVVGVNIKGETVSFNAVTGTKTKTCKERERTSNQCNVLVKKKNGRLFLVNRDGKKVNQIYQKQTTIIGFEGSYCVIDYSNGTARLTCVPQTWDEMQKMLREG